MKILKSLLQAHDITTEKILLLKKLLLIVMTIVLTTICYFVIGALFDRNLFAQSINILINIDLSLFALQIATFTLLLSPFKRMEQKVEKRKAVYIREIAKNKALYDTEIYDKLNDYLYFYNRQFRYNIFMMIILLLHFVTAIISSCVNTVSQNLQLTLLFANLLFQFFYLLHYILLLTNLFCSRKKSIELNISDEKEYLETKLKVYNTNKTYMDKYKIAHEIELMSRAEENNG